MKKHLIAAAVAAAVMAPAAFAQSSVTVYGVVDFGYDDRKVDGSIAGATGVVTAGKTTTRGFFPNNNATSRIGFRGTEDLGGGLKASFQIETGFNATAATVGSSTNSGTTSAGSTTFGDRALWLELSGDFGALRAGRQDTNQRAQVLAYNMAGYSNVTGNNMSATAPDTGNGITMIDDRYNAVKYTSNSFGGLRLNAAVFQDEVKGATAATDAGGSGFDIGAVYSAGPLSASLAYLNSDAKTGTTNDKEKKVVMAGASYDLGAAKLAVMYQDAENKDSIATNTNQEVKAYQLGVAVPVGGSVTAFATWGKTETKYATALATVDGNAYQLGGRYNLSKRTSAYAVYGNTSRDALTGGVEAKITEVAVGLQHSF